MNNSVHLILHILYFKYPKYLEYNLKLQSLKDLLYNDDKIISTCSKSSDCFINNEFYLLDIKNLDLFLQNNSKEHFDYIVDDMFEVNSSLKIEKHTFLTTTSTLINLSDFEKDYNLVVKQFNNMTLHQREIFLKDILLSDEATFFAIKTTFFEPLSAISFNDLVKYNKDNNTSYDWNKRKYHIN